MRPVTSGQYPLWSQYRGTNSGGSLQRLLVYFIVLARMPSMKYRKTSVFICVTLGWEVTPLTNWETFDGVFVEYEWVKSFGGYEKCQMMQCHKLDFQKHKWTCHYSHCLHQWFSIPVLTYHFRPLFYSTVSALRSGHHRIFRHDSSSKGVYMFHSNYIKGVLLCSFTMSWFCFVGVLEHALMLGGSKNALFFT